ncbi:MAG: RHS repeat-associated core domain-containing protein, partial [bacterium]
THDALGRQTSASSPSPFRGEGGGEGADGSVGSTTHYNALGQIDWTMDAASNTTTYIYDTLGRRTQVTDALSGATYTAYDIDSRVLATWGATYPVAYDYDEYGRMTAMYTLRDSSLVISNYSSFITHTSSFDRTRWLYDETTGLLTNKTYADGHGPAYTYTPDGKLSTRTWARGVITSYSYDALGQLTNIHYSTTNTPDVSFAYDRLGRQTTITDGQGTRTFTYNDALQLASESDPLLGGAGGGFSLSRAYDQYGRSTGFTAGTNYTIRYAYDQVGHFTAVSNNVGGALRAATYSYLPESDLLSGLSNGPVQITRSYEENRNLITQIKNTSGSTLISQYDYANDPIGRRTSVGMSGEAFSDLGVTHNKYAYNARSELEQAKRYAGTNLASTANAIDGQAYLYDYDLIGNRTEVYTGDMLNGSKHTYTANALNQYTQKTVPSKARIMGAAASDATITVNNQATTRYGQYFQSCLDIANSSSAAFPLVSVVGVKKNSGTNGLDVITTATGHVFVAQTPEQFGYDDDGNLTQDGRWSYTWDAENRLIGMETLTNLPSAIPRLKLAFAYDYMSRRIGKTVSTNSSFIIQTSSFLYDGWNLISELSTANGLLSTNSYVWGLDLSGSLQGAGGIGGLLASTTQQPSNSTTVFYLFDANGNVGQLVSTNGSILARYEYDPYGKLIKDVADSSVRSNPFKFSTKYLDAETGLYYYGYRYYQPETGRWLSNDPIGISGGLNQYVFCANNPVNFRDPWGLCEGNSTLELGASGSLNFVAGELHVGVAINDDFMDSSVYFGGSVGFNLPWRNPRWEGGASVSLTAGRDPDHQVSTGRQPIIDSNVSRWFFTGGVRNYDAHTRPAYYAGIQTPTEVSTTVKPIGGEISITYSTIINGVSRAFRILTDRMY